MFHPDNYQQAALQLQSGTIKLVVQQLESKELEVSQAAMAELMKRIRDYCLIVRSQNKVVDFSKSPFKILTQTVVNQLEQRGVPICVTSPQPEEWDLIALN
jgi:mitochondrial fission protein ELM1